MEREDQWNGKGWELRRWKNKKKGKNKKGRIKGNTFWRGIYYTFGKIYFENILSIIIIIIIIIIITIIIIIIQLEVDGAANPVQLLMLWLSIFNLLF
jgi:hypothetical protein